MIEQEGISPADRIRLSLMVMTDLTAPMKEWLAGEVAYFTAQGFTLEQSRAMAAAEFMTAFGGRIEIGATMPGDDEGPHPEG